MNAIKCKTRFLIVFIWCIGSVFGEQRASTEPKQHTVDDFVRYCIGTEYRCLCSVDQRSILYLRATFSDNSRWFFSKASTARLISRPCRGEKMARTLTTSAIYSEDHNPTIPSSRARTETMDSVYDQCLLTFRQTIRHFRRDPICIQLRSEWIIIRSIR